LKAQSRFSEEEDRVQSYLHSSSQEKILGEFLNEYIDQHALKLLRMENSGLVAMLHQNQVQDLKLMHSLFKRVPGAYEKFKQELKAFIVSEGVKLVGGDLETASKTSEAASSGSQSEDLIKNLIQFRERMMTFLQQSMGKDPHVEMTIKSSFEDFINRSDRTAKALVAYLEEQFKKDFRSDSEAVISEKLDKVI
jgi:hypothetical protein